MPVEEEDLDEGTRRYEAILRDVAGTPPVLDLVQLGLGEDGHTASLFPGDPALQAVDSSVVVTGLHMGRWRMTLTFPAIDRARCILWLVTGSGKTAALERLRAGDRSIPAGCVRTPRGLLADKAAGGWIIGTSPVGSTPAIRRLVKPELRCRRAVVPIAIGGRMEEFADVRDGSCGRRHARGKVEIRSGTRPMRRRGAFGT
jgi:hypothetical protein